jgi:hypothetical protein
MVQQLGKSVAVSEIVSQLPAWWAWSSALAAPTSSARRGAARRGTGSGWLAAEPVHAVG